MKLHLRALLLGSLLATLVPLASAHAAPGPPGSLAPLATPTIKGATISNGRVCWHLDVAKAHSTHTFKFHAKVDSNFLGGSFENVSVATAGNAPKVSARAPVNVAHVGGRVNRKKSPVTG